MVKPPATWFADPQLTGPTALHVDPDGRVYGHIAQFGIQHVGMDDPQTAPRSRSGYRWFRTGAVLTADGTQVATGRITLGAGHAAEDAGVTGAAEHYDNTCTAVADVAVGEDEHGIWCAGAIRPGVTDEQVYALRGSPISGDWRRIDDEWELMAALAVNVPGFPVPRLTVAASGTPLALVAAGVLMAAAAPAKPPAKKPPPKPAAKKPPPKQPPGAGGDFNSKHPRGAAGSSTGGQFVPLGTARSAEAAKAQKDPKAHAAYDALLKAKPGDRAGQLKALKDADLQALSRTAYSFKSSDPKVVAARVAIANELARRGQDVKKFGALGGGPAAKKAPAPARKAPARKAAPAKKPAPKKAPAPRPAPRKAAVAAAGTVAAPASTPRKDNPMPVTLTDDQVAAIRSALGVADDADGAAITAALTEALAAEEDSEEEGAGEGEGDGEPAGAAPALAASLPPGLVAIDATQLSALRAAAQRGDDARTAQERAERQALVATAIQDGRIPPARREHWLTQLEHDPGVAAVLASLAPGLVPVGDPIGHAGAGGDSVADDLYESVFGKES